MQFIRKWGVFKMQLNEEIKTKIVNILKNNDVLGAYIFGSFARNEGTEESDIDIIVDLPKNKSLFDLVGIKLELEDELGIKADVVTTKSLNSKIKEKVLQERVKIV